MAYINATCPICGRELTLVQVRENMDSVLVECIVHAYREYIPISDTTIPADNKPLSAAMSGNSKIITVTVSDG